ncbi:hypothetical protein QFC22_006236 [Naganishia vaughanmartiniae]|uniref:Uncharacterized protein n=1 Tax=Naganishia vaughanmartiniae TaxID=1424756 RepID=A0ACC2WLV3_9TREE|nr:hypothetical protein QFC22_006236 [Naganishia vaughanmartiniae]
MPAVTATTPSPPETPHGEQPTRVLGGGSRKQRVKVTSTERHQADDGEEEVTVTERTALVPSGSGGSGRAYDATTSDRDIESPSAEREATRAERRILTTPLLFAIFLSLVLITAVNFTLTLLLAESTSYQLASVWGKLGLRSRGDGLVPMWVAAVGGWTGLGAIVFVLLLPLEAVVRWSSIVHYRAHPLVLETGQRMVETLCLVRGRCMRSECWAASSRPRARVIGVGNLERSIWTLQILASPSSSSHFRLIITSPRLRVSERALNDGLGSERETRAAGARRHRGGREQRSQQREAKGNSGRASETATMLRDGLRVASRLGWMSDHTLPPGHTPSFCLAAIASFGFSIGAADAFSQPISLLLLTNLFSLVLLLPLFLLTIISPPLRREYYPLLALPLGATVLTYLLAIGASIAVSRAREKEGRRVLQSLARRHGLRTAPDSERQATVVKTTSNGDGTRTTTAATATTAPAARSAAQEEQVARVLVGMESSGYLGTIWSWIRALAAFIGGLLGAMCLVVSRVWLRFVTADANENPVQLLLCNLCLSAYDNTTPLLREESKLVSVQPKGYPWSYNVHLLCADPPKKGEAGEADPTFTMSLGDLDVLSGGGDQFPPDHKRPRKNTTHFPTILYEAPSGVPGSIAFLPPARVRNPNNPFPQPQPPNNGTEINQVSPYPGSWIVALQAAHKVHRVCVWDRPGYGFSDTGPVEFGQVVESLHQALERSGEKGPFILVGDGYGGLLTRVFAAKYASLVHSVLYVDSQSAQTWFRFPPEYNMLTLRVHRFFTHLLPTLISPLGITRFYSLFTQYDPSMSRVLASKRPSPSTAQLSTPLRSRLTAEVYESHTHHSASYTALLKAQPPRYPSDKPAIILSSDEQMQRNKAWAEGQRALAEEITSETGREAWVVVKGGVGHDLCSPTGGKDGRGRRACSRALIHLFSIE